MRRRRRRRSWSRALAMGTLAALASLSLWAVWPRISARLQSHRDAEADLTADSLAARSAPLAARAVAPAPLSDPTAERRDARPKAQPLAAAAQSDELLTPLGSRRGSADAPGLVGEARADPAGRPEATPATADPQRAPPSPGVSPQGPGANPTPPDANPTRPSGDPAPASSEHPAIRAALERRRAGAVIEARQELNRLLSSATSEPERAEIRAHLARIAEETIFSRRRVGDDPLLETYTVRPGDLLARIAPRYQVPHEGIAIISGLADANRLGVGQTLLVPRGPFHARIVRSAFRLDLYLQDVYLRSFPVGLGADQGTPLGKWLVKERLANPTYYPPPSSPIKRIVPPHDPANPLGGRWIGLEGLDGEAVGRTGYGIHGTIEPETIGKNASLGCVRMYNDDVALVYGLLQPGASTVTVVP